MTLFYLFISIFFIVGFAMLFWGIKSYYMGQKSLSWPKVPVSIISCELERDSDSDGDSYSVKVDYEYEVDGLKISGDKLAFGYSGSSNRESHVAIKDKLEKNKDEILVSYNPTNPRESVIASGFNQSTLTILAFAITWLLFVSGFTFIWVSLTDKDQRILNQIVTFEEFESRTSQSTQRR